MSKPIDDDWSRLPLSNRSRNALRAEKLTVADVRKMGRIGVSRLPNIGHQSTVEICALLGIPSHCPTCGHPL